MVIPSYDFAIGTVLGLVISFAGYAIIESVKSANYKKSVKTAIKSELKNLSDFMGKFLTQIDPNQVSILEIRDKTIHDEAEIMLSGVIPRVPYAHFSIFNYNAVPTEMKVMVFDGETLVQLERVYQRIRNYGVLVQHMVFSTSKKDLAELKAEIDRVIEKL